MIFPQNTSFTSAGAEANKMLLLTAHKKQEDAINMHFMKLNRNKPDVKTHTHITYFKNKRINCFFTILIKMYYSNITYKNFFYYYFCIFSIRS